MSHSRYFTLLLLAVLLLTAGPTLVRAEGDPPTPTRITPPPITGLNPSLSAPEGHQGDITPSGLPALSALPEPVPIQPPVFVEPGASSRDLQSPGDIDCGTRALSQRLEDKGLENAPSPDQLQTELEGAGLRYDWGTGVQELAALARQHGFQGSLPFQDWSWGQLRVHVQDHGALLVALGVNGPRQPGHFAVLTGISPDGNWVTLEDPALGRRVLAREHFLALWENQGSSGLTVQRQPLPAAADPLLPWLGLFSALSLLTVMAGREQGRKEIERLLDGLRGRLADPRRTGIGGGLQTGLDTRTDVLRVPKYKNKKVLKGYQSVEKQVPVYKWKKVRTGWREKVFQEPVYETKKIRVATRLVTRKVPRYVNKQIRVGTRTVRKQVAVTRWRRKTITRWKKVRKRVPVYRRLGWKRVRVGTRTVVRWKKIRRVKRVPYQTLKTVTRQVPVVKDIRVQQGFRTVKEEVPVYEKRRVQTGWKEVVRRVPVYEDKKVRVGTRTVVEKVPRYETVRIQDGWQEIPLHEAKNSPSANRKVQQEDPWYRKKAFLKEMEQYDQNLTVDYYKELADKYGVFLANELYRAYFTKEKWWGWSMFTAEEIEDIYSKIKGMRKINLTTINKSHDVVSKPCDMYPVPDLNPDLENVPLPFQFENINADDVYRTLNNSPVQTINQDTYQRIKNVFLGDPSIYLHDSKILIASKPKKFGKEYYYPLIKEEGNNVYFFLAKKTNNGWVTEPKTKVKIKVR